MFEFEKEFVGLLREFQRKRALAHLVLIGSWCLPVYREHYPIRRFAFTTSDIDFSIQRPRDLRRRSGISLQESLTKLGYVPKSGILSKAEKYIPAPDSESNSLSIEFLCEPGRNTSEPYHLPGLGIVANPVPYQKILLENLMTLTYKKISVQLPQPAVWAIHKIAISQLRKGKDRELKMIKDMDNALVVLNWLGKEKILLEADHFKGKFKKLFLKGLQIMKIKYEI
ncbi:MAG: nucleotidyltransferase domain-containing protein [Candidatus Aminicenantes bacterium]|nr:nucleotidyltransferase domain-containing protein [Candidatus Aminicenantes bacterium]